MSMCYSAAWVGRDLISFLDVPIRMRGNLMSFTFELRTLRFGWSIVETYFSCYFGNLLLVVVEPFVFFYGCCRDIILEVF